LPDELRAEKVVYLAEALPLGVRDAGFEGLVGHIDTGPIHQGNQVQLFFRGEDAFASVCQAIEGATEEILLETYILRDDATGRKLLRLLGGAAARGVKVRVLADAFGSWTTKRAFWLEMQTLGIEARLFRPFWSQMRGFLFRDHRKIIVIDRRISFTGGMNVANEYGSSRHNKDASWRDTHMRVEGPTAWEMTIVFSEAWERSGGTSLHLPPLAPTDTGGARTLVLDSRPGRGHAETAAVLAALVGASRKRLWITNSYFAPNRTAIRLLGQAAQRGVDVRLLLQGHTDMPLVRHAGHGNFADLLACGVRLFEYQSAILHAKTLVADDYVSVVGSSNLDFRSFYFNAECNVLIFDDATGQTMAETFQEDLGQSTELRLETWNQRPLAHRLGDALARCFSPLL
jgi:cardiolipin synthase